MIKGLMTGPDGQAVLLGLTHDNVASLFADELIIFRPSAPPPDGFGLEGAPDVVLVAGTDESTIVSALTSGGLVTFDTTFHGPDWGRT